MGFETTTPTVLGLVRTISRTAATGSVDTSSSPDKASLTSLTSSKRTVDDNIIKAVGRLCHVSPPEATPSLLEEVNSYVSGVDATFRSWNVDKYRYAQAEDVPQIFRTLVLTIRGFRRSAGRTAAVDATFWVHWHVNLRGHVFADGCSRTACILGAWVSHWISDEIVPLPSRDLYIAVARSPEPLEAWRAYTEDGTNPHPSPA